MPWHGNIIAPQITNQSTVGSTEKTLKIRIGDSLWENPSVFGGIISQSASNMESFSMSWCHHELWPFCHWWWRPMQFWWRSFLFLYEIDNDDKMPSKSRDISWQFLVPRLKIKMNAFCLGCNNSSIQTLTSMAAWISNYIHYKTWDDIIFPFPNFNGATVEVSEWINIFIPLFTGRVTTYPCRDSSWTMLVKEAPDVESGPIRHLFWWFLIRCWIQSRHLALIQQIRVIQNGCHFADGILKPIILNENQLIYFIQISLKCVPINSKPAVVEEMAWRRAGETPIPQPMMS